MFGRPEWFARRKYGGWGLHPKTWQGWVYIAFFLLPFVIIQSVTFWDEKTRIYFTLGWVVFLAIDVIQIMSKLKKDEREYKIEAIAERNAAWIMVGILVIGVLYESITSALSQQFRVNVFLVIALFGGVIAKCITNFYLERRGI